MAVIFRAVNRHWRLIGSGKISSLEALPIPAPLKEGAGFEEGFEVKISLPPQVVTTAEAEENEEEDEEELPRLILTEELIAECQKVPFLFSLCVVCCLWYVCAVYAVWF